MSAHIIVFSFQAFTTHHQIAIYQSCFDPFWKHFGNDHPLYIRDTLYLPELMIRWLQRWPGGLRGVNQSKVCQLKLIPDQRSEVMFDMILGGGRIKSIISVGFLNNNCTIVEIVTNFLDIIVVIDSVTKFSTPSIFDKLLFYLITPPS